MAQLGLGLAKTAVEGTLSLVKKAIEEEEDLKVKVQDDLVFITGEFEMMQSFLRVANKERAKNEVVQTWVRQVRTLAFDVEDQVEIVIHLDIKSYWRGCHGTEQLALATDTSAFDHLSDVWKDLGKWRSSGDIETLILKSQDQDLQVISVWGCGEADDQVTSSVFWKVLGDAKICQEFKSRAWVKLTHPFSPTEFLNNLITQFYTTSHQANEMVSPAAPLALHELVQMVKDHKYLIFLEEVSSKAEWDAIRMHLPGNKNGSRIVVFTKHLRLALLFTGEPYQVSQLSRGLSQPICAISKKGELIWQISCGGVISVWGNSQDISAIIHNVYTSIMYKSKQFEGVEFKRHSWHPFNLAAFSRRLLLDFHSDDLKAKRIAAVALMERRQDPIQESRQILRSHKCLVVIDGLQTKGEWDKIKEAFLSELNNGCIIVTTNEESVATYVSEEAQLFRGSREKVDRLLIKGCAPRLFSHRCVHARDMANTFPLIGSQAESAYQLADNRMIPGVTAVWGIPGTGKSTLVRSMYSHKMLGLWQTLEHPSRDVGMINHIRSSPSFTGYGWVDVPCPFNLMELSRRLLLDFLSDDLQAKEAAAIGVVEGEDLIHSCRTIMQQRRCLVVIDGLWSTDDWDLIKDALLTDTVTCVLVVTSGERVATYCADNNTRVVNVKCLEAGSALSLFKNIREGNKLTHEMQLSEGVMAKCGGIMKVIDAIGGSQKDLSNLIDYEFMGIAYFDECSDSLKPCIFYMNIFPANQNIRKRRLLRRWIAEGYCSDTSDKATGENWERLFDELAKLSIIQLNGESVLQANNSFFRGYNMSRPMEDNLVFALDGNCGLKSQQAGQHLTISKSWNKDKIVFEDMDFSRLRSLTVFGGWTSFLISKKMKVLRVLDLEDASRDIKNDDLEQIGKLMPCLKFLSLRGHEEITRLPDSVGSLRQLQTLDVRHTSVTTLPPAILKLQKLQYVRAGTTITSDGGDATATAVRSSPPTLVSSLLSKFCKCGLGNNGGVTVPAKIGNLTALQTLGVVNIDVACGKGILKEIKKLTQLHRLGIAGVNRECWQDFCSAISGHGHLKSLSVKLIEDKKGVFARFDEISQPPMSLERLKVYGQVQILPGWVRKLQHLRKVKLGLTIFTQMDLKDFHSLQNVEYLYVDRICIKPAEDCQQLYVGAEYCSSMFPIIEIECTTNSSVYFGRMGVVSMLNAHCSRGSTLEISGLRELVQLKEVCLKGYYDDELKQDLQRQTEEHPNKPLLKLEEPRSS
ncbi:hypothetical protein BS78_09G070900 [Paspalum vaginatum]|nr:hypothetical protein BS78_09G070900 [Paspalum vaginatum]